MRETTELIRQYIKNAETGQALETLLTFVNRYFGGEEQDEVLLLHSKFSDYQVRLRQNLVEDDIERNQINLAVLKICRVLEAKTPVENIHPLTPAASNSTNHVNERLSQLDAQLRMVHKMLERLTDDEMDRFQRSRIWDQLEPQTKDHLLAAIALDRDDYLEDYASVILELCEGLEFELRSKIFLPYRSAFKKDGRTVDREYFYDHSVSQVKNHLYDFLYKDKDLTLSQMVRVLYENLESRNDVKDNLKFLHILEFLFSRFKIKNMDPLIKVLKFMSQARFDRKSKSFIVSVEEASQYKKMVVAILSGIQATRN
ncbi:MAG: hypothetical protein KDC34_09595 [Saprospiraceae bacterium]|nr:hypothetical protein [Saprospiraceae bacterium]